MHSFKTPSGAQLLCWQWQVSFLCKFVHTYLCMSNFLFCRLANWETLLQAKLLGAEIKQLCLAVMVHKILFKIRLLSKKGDKKGTKENKSSTLRERCLKPNTFLPTLITISQNLLEQNTWGSLQSSDAHSSWQKLLFGCQSVWRLQSGWVFSDELWQSK